jgi:hypothetical protein
LGYPESTPDGDGADSAGLVGPREHQFLVNIRNFSARKISPVGSKLKLLILLLTAPALRLSESERRTLMPRRHAPRDERFVVVLVLGAHFERANTQF